MSPARAAAALPNALSFTRSAMRRLVRGRYTIDKLRFDLDAEGRGEILYRLDGEGWMFHFFLVSQKLPEAVKTDRNFAQSWDAMGVLCQGEWTPRREALLRREVPKQRAGFADYDTLIYARGNRSARLFDHVVDSLAAGRQPDARVLAPVGYILRTTAFIGNGQLGTRPFEGYEADHPFKRPYHAQFASAFVLREYVFDLVDHLARCRNPDAATLAPELRRYLGLGNAAATGLVPFVVNHPHLMHRWTAANEQALATAKQRSADCRDVTGQRFTTLLDKAIRHASEGARPDDGVFAPAQALASDLERVRRGYVAGRERLAWSALADWARVHVGAEACETLDAILLELYPDIVDALDDAFQADERFEIQPAMRVDALARLLRAQYDWALHGNASDGEQPHFWYRTTKTPRDVRRGVRGQVSAFEFENAIDTVREIRRLDAALADADPSMAAGDLACARPDLRHIVTRVQSLAGLDYAELRADWLAPGFSPFGPVRFVLSLFGLEKFEAAMPKSVRGTFMQGAPIAEDVARGLDGDWPFPLIPSSATIAHAAAANTEPDSVLPSRLPAGEPDANDVLRLAPRELARMIQNALQGHGAALGVAEFAAGLAVFEQARDARTCDVVLRHCTDRAARSRAQLDVSRRGSAIVAIDAHDACALHAAADALDQAELRARNAGVGAVVATRAQDASLLGALPIEAAQRGCIALLVWSQGGADHGFSAAACGERGPWHVQGTLRASAKLSGALQDGVLPFDSDPRVPLADQLHAALSPTSVRATFRDTFAFVCFASLAATASDALLAGLARWAGVSPVAPSIAITRPDELAARYDAWRLRGVSLRRAQFDALGKAGEAILVPVDEEHRILRDGADPLKVF